VGRTILICSVALAGLAGGLAQPALAARNDLAALRAYVRGRAAIADDRLGDAARLFQMALTDGGPDPMLRQRTFGLALLSGDEKLSRTLAQQIEEGGGKSGLDTRLVLLSSAVQKKDWARARAIRDELMQGKQLLFALPIIDSWIAFGSGGDTLAPIQNIGRDAAANAYAAEHRALVLGAMGRIDEALTAFQPLVADDEGRSLRMKLAAAALLQRQHRDDDALAMLNGDSPVLKMAAADVRDHRALETGVLTPADGLAALFTRLAVDLSAEKATPASIAIARLATFLAPSSGDGWVVTANMLALDGKPEAAMQALSHVSQRDPFLPQAQALSITLLQRLGRGEEALAVAQTATARPQAGADEWAQLGETLTALGRPREAADAYGEAIRRLPADKPSWSLFLLRGSAFEQAGDWKSAEPELRRALALAPDQPVVMNYLGYGLLDRGLHVAEARKLIEQASALRPRDAAISDSLAWVYYRDGDYSRAIPLLERAVQLEPGEPTINEHLGDAYWQVGRRLEARYAWRAALVTAEGTDVIDRLKAKIDIGMDGSGMEGRQKDRP